MRELRAQNYGDLEIIVGANELDTRRRQGWTPANAQGLEMHHLPAKNWWAFSKRVIDENPKAFHLFGGLWSDRRFLPILAYAQFKKIHVGLITESFMPEIAGVLQDESTIISRIKAWLRPFAYRIAGLTLAHRMQLVFCISELACKQFSKAGFCPKTIYPFGYFVPADRCHALDPPIPALVEGQRYIFVGNLIKTKGLQTLTTAFELAASATPQATLDIYGHGSTALIEPLPQSVRYAGPIEFGRAQCVIHEYDALILPSLYDGWGVVVNEALLQGVPVIISDAAGAHAIVQRFGAGKVFAKGNALQLAEVLKTVAENPILLADWKRAALLCQEFLAPQVAAHYLLMCIEHALGQSDKKPVAPWYS